MQEQIFLPETMFGESFQKIRKVVLLNFLYNSTTTIHREWTNEPGTPAES